MEIASYASVRENTEDNNIIKIITDGIVASLKETEKELKESMTIEHVLSALLTTFASTTEKIYYKNNRDNEVYFCAHSVICEFLDFLEVELQLKDLEKEMNVH